jgi:murein DD-endopeptidase MepM/ murein hydrolase activator NlpD
MAKVKYRYNPHSLSYDVITTSTKEKLKKWGFMFAASVVISVIYFGTYSLFYETPKERTLTNRLSALKFNHQMLLHDLKQIDYILSDIQKRDDDVYRTILETEPIPNSIRQAGFGGVNRYEPLEGYLNSNLMINTARYTDKILKQLYVQSISYDELIAKALNKEQMTLSRPAILPIAKKNITSESRFGWRMHPKLGYGRPHTGMDFSAKTGTEIYATGDGTVVKTEFNRGGYGNIVIIDHGFGYETYYAHMQSFKVTPGMEVKRGQVIGTVGNTGRSVGPHVHYEVRKKGVPVNPIHYFYNDLSEDEYNQLVERAQNNNEIFEDWQEMTIEDDEIEVSESVLSDY